MKTPLLRSLFLVWVVLNLILPARAQTTAAHISGRITDPTEAAITGAAITVINQNTGIRTNTVSNEEGDYLVPLLPPGTYRILIEKEGFRSVERSGITLHVNQAARIDFSLELGLVSEKVSVTADAPLLQLSEASLGAVIDNRKILDLPLNGRNPFDLVFLTPGAFAYRRPFFPGNNIPLTNFSVNGGPAMLNEVLLDGIPDTSPQYNQYVVIPSIDAVQEFKVQTSNMSAEFGRTGGGVINVSMRSGSNRLHGSVYEFLRNSALDANRWVNNRTGQPKPPFRYNQFGASAGGPIRRDRTFFFGNYEGLRRRTGRTFLFSVPTVEQRRGDFTRTRAQNGQLVEVFDPLTTRQVAPGRFERDPFPGNLIPESRLNQIGRNILPFWAPSNLPGDPVTGINNFISNASESFALNQMNVRIDHACSDANRLFGRFSWNESEVTPPNVFKNDANPASGPQLFTQRNLALNDTHSFSPRTFATFRIGFTRLRDSGRPLDLNFDSTKLGFPAYFRDAQPARVFPSLTVTGYTVSDIGFGTSSVGPVGGALLNNISNGYTGQSDVTHMRGKHVLKSGVEYRLFRLHGFRPFLPNFSFIAGFTQGPDPTRGGPTAGHPFASFLLGAAAGGEVRKEATQDTQTRYFAAFLQDDYKVTPALTLNLGLRFETENLRTDRYNRLTFLDFSSPSPLRALGLGPLRGGLRYVGVDGNPREQARVTYNWSPRFGFAWQWRPSRVLRGGYGIFFAPRTGWDFNLFGQDGFRSLTPYVATVDGVTPITFINDPYPNGFVEPTGSSLGLLTNAGGAISVTVDRDQKGIYMQQWNLAVQQTFPLDMAVEVSYVGTKGTHLLQNLQYNQLPDQFLALREELRRTVPNPFFGLVDRAQPLGGPTVSAGQLLRPYPQFTSVATQGSTAGSSTYHALQLRAEKRFSHGLNLLLSYSFSKLIDDGAPGRIAWIGDVPGFQNHNNRRLERSVNSQQGPHSLSTAAGYELPVGRGKPFLSAMPGYADMLLGGWQVNVIYTYRTGIPLSLATAVNNTNSFGGGSRPNNNGRSAKLSGDIRKRLTRYFDTSVFSSPEPFSFGNVSRTLPDVFGPSQSNFDFSILKTFSVTERVRLQFRAEAFNALNQVNFALPGTALGAPTFGVISSAGEARIVQFGLKLYF